MATRSHAPAALAKRWRRSRRCIRLASPREPSPFLIAVVAVGLDDRDRALESLERAFEARDWALPMMKANPFFDSLRSEARFVAVLDRLGLPH